MASVTIHTREMSREIQNPEVEVSAETKRHQEEICALHAIYKEMLARKDTEHQKKVEALTEAYNEKDSEYKIACVKIMDKTKIVDELNKHIESLLLQLKAERKNFKENSNEVRVDSQKAMEQEVRIKLLEKSGKKRRKMLTYVYKQYQALKKRNKELEQVNLEWHEFSRVEKLRRGHLLKGHSHKQLKEANDEASEYQMQYEDLQQKSPTNGIQIQKPRAGAERVKTRKLRKQKRMKERSSYVVRESKQQQQF